MKGISSLRALMLVSILVLCSASVSAQYEPQPVINGKPSRDNAWPWIAALYSNKKTAITSQYCGASLISPRYVLTAAHCVAGRNENSIGVLIGKTSLTAKNAIEATAKEVYLHPQYRLNSDKYDIALIRLSKSVTMQPIKLQSPADEPLNPNQVAMVLGWGQTERYINYIPDKLQEAAVPVINESLCKTRMGSSFDPESMLCAGTLSSSSEVIDGVDSCIGDSGGPLIRYTQAGWQQIGITSWGYECASSYAWGVYSDVAKYFNWTIHTPLKKALQKALRAIKKNGKKTRKKNVLAYNTLLVREGLDLYSYQSGSEVVAANQEQFFIAVNEVANSSTRKTRRSALRATRKLLRSIK